MLGEGRVGFRAQHLGFRARILKFRGPLNRKDPTKRHWLVARLARIWQVLFVGA